MKKCVFIFILSLFALTVSAQRKTDALDRGLVAVPNNDGIFLSWRILPEEYYNVTYNVYRNGTKLNASPLAVSNYVDTGGATSSSYTVKAVKNGVEQTACAAVMPWTTYEYDSQWKRNNYYKKIPVADVYDRKGTLVYCACGSHIVSDDVLQKYGVNDIALGDVDGDGQIDFIVKRTNDTDSEALFPTSNTTAFCRIEVYASSQNYGLLWWIDCGPNTVYGPDEQWDAVAFDWDQDGRCEIVYRAYGNTIIHKADGSTITIGSLNENIRPYVSHSANSTFTNCGTEWLLYIDGLTGQPYVTMEYPLKRLEASEFSTEIDWSNPNANDVNNYINAVKTQWGDDYGHRSSKYFVGAPYLDGRNPSLYLGRGIYTRHKMIAYDIDPITHTLTERWQWSCLDPSSPWYGNGYHNFSIGDVDEDGRDEIIYGSMVIDDNGKGLHTTGFGHGDALHNGDLDPFRKGQEIFACLEEYPYWGNNYRNATTGEIYYKYTDPSVPTTESPKGGDDGRCMAANLTNDYPGCIGASSKDGVVALSAETPMVMEEIPNNWSPGSGTPTPSALNFRIYWDGDLLDETLNGPGANYAGNPMYVNKMGNRILQTVNTLSNNGKKKNPGAQGDILGDWREEIVLRASDNKSFYIYTTTTPTEYRIPSLWYDHQYRQAMVWQTFGYNQPPHVSYFLGELEGITVAPPPITNTGRTELPVGSVITSSHNGKQVMLCDDGNYGIEEGGASPEVLIVNVPSIVSGSNNNTLGQGITYTYKQTQLGATINDANCKGDLTGSMRLVKQGEGLLKLTARTFTYSGNTDVWGGSVYFRGTLKNSPVWMNRHTSLYTAGTYNRKVTMEYGATLNINYNKADGTTEYSATNIDTLELHEGARIVFDINQASAYTDILNLKHLILRTQSWEYGPKYLTPVLQVNSPVALAKGIYPIGKINSVSGDINDIEIECEVSDDSYSKQLYASEGMLYLRIYDADSDVADPLIKMTYVNSDEANNSYGEVAKATSGYNIVSNNIVGFAYAGWKVNYITYIQIDASAYKGSTPGTEMKLSIDCSGSTDGKRETSWGIGYNSSEWSSDMSYSSADKSITLIGDVQNGTTKSASTYETFTWDIKDVFDADEDGILTIVVYETEAAGGYITSPKLITDYSLCFDEQEENPVVTEVRLTDNDTHSATQLTELETLTYTRTMQSDELNNWTSLYLPFSFEVSEYTDKFDLAEIFALCTYQDTNGDGIVDSNDEELLIVNKKTSGQTSPNMPYLIRPKSVEDFTISSIDGLLYAATSGVVRTATTKTLYTFTGTNKAMLITPENGYYYLSGGQLSNVSVGSVELKPFRWYTTITPRSDNYGHSSSASSSAKSAYRIMVVGEDLDIATAVKIARGSMDVGDNSMYDIMGRKVKYSDSLPAGVYIKNNKKIVVK